MASASAPRRRAALIGSARQPADLRNGGYDGRFRSDRLVFGSIYAQHHDVLLQSLNSMNDSYGGTKSGRAVTMLESEYVRLLGIPEIGFRRRAMEFRRILRRLHRPLDRVLDAGSGVGVYAMWLADRYPNATVIGCDIDGAKTAFCNSLQAEHAIGNLEFVCRDVTRLAEIGAPFDLAICIDVLEHIHDYQSALSCLQQVLRPGGYLYIHTPRIKQSRLLKRFDRWHHRGHIHEGFDLQALCEDLVAAGLNVIDARDTFGLVGKLAWELNHLTLRRSLPLAGAIFPVLLAAAYFDRPTSVGHGLGLSILAEKPESTP